MVNPTVLEICAGAGGQAIGLEEAGFECAAAVEIDADACCTLRPNRPGWQVIQGDVREVSGRDFRGVDLLAGGVRARRSPSPGSNSAGKTSVICSPGTATRRGVAASRRHAGKRAGVRVLTF